MSLGPNSEFQKAQIAQVKKVGFAQGLVSDARAEGLWFLKHSTMDRNEGVVCFKGNLNAEIMRNLKSRRLQSLYVVIAGVLLHARCESSGDHPRSSCHRKTHRCF